MAYKYEVYEHPTGSVKRGDDVAAFVPGKDGNRFVTIAIVEGINRKSIRVSYYVPGYGNFEATVKDHQWCFIKEESEMIIDFEYQSELVARSTMLGKLIAGGVHNWDGYAQALEEEIGY